MRTEKEMLDLIISKAEGDSRILAAYLKGSRANPNVSRDIYQDYDVMYIVKETDSFITDTSWLKDFGSVILKQEQNCPFGYGQRFGLLGNYDRLYSWLLMFDDGSRIDIGVETLPHFLEASCRGKLFLPLVDKSGCLHEVPPPSDEDYWVRRPSSESFSGCCCEFFWSLCDVLKGAARDELPFAMATYYSLSHPMLEKMLEWYVGCNTGFSKSCGKLNKYFKNLLPEDVYSLYTESFSGGSYPQLMEAISCSCRLFHETALYVADKLSCKYPREYEEGFANYCRIMGFRI